MINSKCQLLVCIPNIFNTWRWLTANAQPHTSHAWLSGWVVRVLDLWSTGCGFKSHLPCCRVQPGQVFFTCRLLSSTSTTGTSQQVAWKATVGLASHWPGITNISGFPPTAYKREMSTEHTPMLSSGVWWFLPHPRYIPHDTLVLQTNN